LAKFRDDGIAERIGHDWVRNIEALFVCPLLQDARYPVKLRSSLAGICARLGQGYTKLIEFEFARQLPVDTYDDAVLGFEVLNFLVGIARLLPQFSDPLLQPEAGAVRRLELRLKLILDISIGKCVRDLRRLGRVKRRESDLLDVAASDPGDTQVVL